MKDDTSLVESLSGKDNVSQVDVIFNICLEK